MISKIFDIARIECGADATDIKDETLLTILNENIREFISILHSKRHEEYFAERITHDIVPNQYRYGKLQYTDSEGRTIKINKVLKVYINGKIAERVDVLTSNKVENVSKPSYGISGQDLYVYHNEKEIITDGIELIGLIELPEITDISAEEETIFLGKLSPDKKILKLGLKPFIYERQENMNSAMNAKQIYDMELKKYISRLGRIKEPIERKIPDLSHYI